MDGIDNRSGIRSGSFAIPQCWARTVEGGNIRPGQQPAHRPRKGAPVKQNSSLRYQEPTLWSQVNVGIVAPATLQIVKVHKFYSIQCSLEKEFYRVNVQYDSVDGCDPLAPNYSHVIEPGFFSQFRFSIRQGALADWVDCGAISWRILSPQLQTVINDCYNKSDITWHQPPEALVRLDERLEKYRMLSIHREVRCLDLERSDLSFFELDGKQEIEAVYDMVICESCVESNCEAFLVVEYPVFIVLRARVANKILDSSLRGIFVRGLGCS